MGIKIYQQGISLYLLIINVPLGKHLRRKSFKNTQRLLHALIYKEGEKCWYVNFHPWFCAN